MGYLRCREENGMRSTVRMGVVLVVVVLSGILGSAEQTSIDWDDHIVHLFEENSILRYEIDWDVFRA